MGRGEGGGSANDDDGGGARGEAREEREGAEREREREMRQLRECQGRISDRLDRIKPQTSGKNHYHRRFHYGLTVIQINGDDISPRF